jgi:23S rRNA pseudouridine2605 synthase
MPDEKKTARNKSSGPEEKIQKVLARNGLASRREIERWVADGRVSINGKIATLGARVGMQDVLRVDGKLISGKKLSTQAPRVLVYNKPAGEVSTRSDPEGRPTVFDHLPPLQGARWIVVGRLDLNTSGLLLFTTDGELANKLMHPSSGMDREYVVRVMGQVDDDSIARMKSGVMLEDGEAKFMDVVAIKDKKKEEAINQWFYCTLMEGRNREVRRLWESQGYKISRLKRVRFGPVVLLAKVKEGTWLELEPKEVAELYEMLQMPHQQAAPILPKEREARERVARKQTPRRVSTRRSEPEKPAPEPRRSRRK